MASIAISNAFLLSAFKRLTSPSFGLMRLLSSFILIFDFINFLIVLTRFFTEISYPDPILIISPIVFDSSAIFINPLTVSLTYVKSLVGYNEPKLIFFGY